MGRCAWVTLNAPRKFRCAQIKTRGGRRAMIAHDRARCPGLCYTAAMPSGEIVRLARRWLRAHGEDAVALARDMASELEASGNVDGAGMWRRVIAEIEKLCEPEAG